MTAPLTTYLCQGSVVREQWAHQSQWDGSWALDQSQDELITELLRHNFISIYADEMF